MDSDAFQGTRQGSCEDFFGDGLILSCISGYATVYITQRAQPAFKAEGRRADKGKEDFREISGLGH